MNDKTYRAYLLVNNRVVDCAQFLADDDIASLRRADEILRASDHAATAEVWHGEHKLGLLDKRRTTT